MQSYIDTHMVSLTVGLDEHRALLAALAAMGAPNEDKRLLLGAMVVNSFFHCYCSGCWHRVTAIAVIVIVAVAALVAVAVVLVVATVILSLLLTWI